MKYKGHPVQIKEIPWFESLEFDNLHESGWGVILDGYNAFANEFCGQINLIGYRTMTT